MTRAIAAYNSGLPKTHVLKVTPVAKVQAKETTDTLKEKQTQGLTKELQEKPTQNGRGRVVNIVI